MIERELKPGGGEKERERQEARSTKGNCCCNLLHSLADTLSNKIRRRLCSVRAGEITSLRTKWTEIQIRDNQGKGDRQVGSWMKRKKEEEGQERVGRGGTRMTLDIYYYGFYENFLLPLNGSWIDPQPSPCKFVFARYENRCHAVEMAVARRIEHENNVIYSQINTFFFFLL